MSARKPRTMLGEPRRELNDHEIWMYTNQYNEYMNNSNGMEENHVNSNGMSGYDSSSKNKLVFEKSAWIRVGEGPKLANGEYIISHADLSSSSSTENNQEEKNKISAFLSNVPSMMFGGCLDSRQSAKKQQEQQQSEHEAREQEYTRLSEPKTWTIGGETVQVLEW